MWTLNALIFICLDYNCFTQVFVLYDFSWVFVFFFASSRTFISCKPDIIFFLIVLNKMLLNLKSLPKSALLSKHSQFHSMFSDFPNLDNVQSFSVSPLVIFNTKVQWVQFFKLDVICYFYKWNGDSICYSFVFINLL